MIDALQKTIQKQEFDIQKLTQQISAKESQAKQEICTQNPVEFGMTEQTLALLELQDMKVNIINLKDELHRMQTEVKLAREEAIYYKTLAVALQTAFHKPTKVKSQVVCMHIQIGSS